MKCILALDQGTTSSRAVVVDRQGRIVSTARKEFGQVFPRPGWVEHDPEEIWSSQLAAARDALSAGGVSAGDVAAIGIANQRETTVLWDRRTGRAICNAIVWQDRRTSEICDRLAGDGLTELIRRRTGLVIDAYFSGPKIRWILDHVAGAAEAARAGHLAFGTVDSWLIWRLTGGRAHLTDASNASRTMLFDIHRGAWDEELLAALAIPPGLLPQVRDSSGPLGDTDADLLGEPIPIAGVAGDQQAALFGQMCTREGMLKNTYGTGCFLLLNTGTHAAASKHNLLTTVAWQLDGRLHYALEGSVFIAGAAVQWFRDGLGLIESAAEIEQLAAGVADNGGVYLVPAFAGLGAPHWDPHARGLIAGITRGTTAGHLARAVLEAIAYQVADVLDAMRADSGIEIAELRADGGACANDLLMQIQADLLGLPVVRPRALETTAMGVAYLAGLAVGYWGSQDELHSQWQVERTFRPAMPPSRARRLREQWGRALERAKGWDSPPPGPGGPAE